MQIEYHKWFSERLNREMELKVYGNYGKPFLVFPSSGGAFHEYEDFKMIEAVAPYINEGRAKFFCIDSIDKETWLNTSASDEHIAGRHEAYHNYVIEEVVPFIYQHCQGHQKICTTGCSLGAFHAANFYFKRPDVFDSVVALSGIYDAEKVLNRNYGIQQIYYNSPLHYLDNISDPEAIANYRKGKIVVCVGKGAFEDEMIEDTAKLKSILKDKGVEAWVEFWGHDVNHDWPWWRIQMPHFMQHVLD